jgi:hypothetical protein
MSELAQKKGFLDLTLILNESATFQRVFDAILSAAGELKKGDLFLFTFSGHGTRPGAVISGEEKDALDEAIVLHDRIMIDNVFKFLLWPKFEEGVRIFAISDSCHSNGVFALNEAPVTELEMNGNAVFASSSNFLNTDEMMEDEVVAIGSGRFREIPRIQARAHVNALPGFYNPLRERIDKAKASPSSTILAKRLFLSACEADDRTEDKLPLGVFTQALKNVWNDGSFSGNYAEFQNAIDQQLPNQTPVLGPEDLDAEFVAQKPFTI